MGTKELGNTEIERMKRFMKEIIQVQKKHDLYYVLEASSHQEQRRKLNDNIEEGRGMMFNIEGT